MIRRLFIGLEPDTSVRARLKALQARLPEQNQALDARDFHLTLVFLGPTDEAQIPRLFSLLSAHKDSCTRLGLDRLGYYARAKVAVIESSAATPELASLADTLGLACGKPDVGAKFRAHVTLARKVNDPNWTPPPPDPIDWVTGAPRLFESRPWPGQPRYAILGP